MFPPTSIEQMLSYPFILTNNNDHKLYDRQQNLDI